MRPVIFLSYSGSMRWRTKAGDEISARLGEPLTKDMTAQAWRTALDPNGEWIPSVLAAADRRLTEVRRAVPDAGGDGHRDRPDRRARVRGPPGADHRASRPTVVLSDDDGASDRIDEFSAGDSALDGRGADGLRGRRRAAARRRRLRDAAPRRRCSSRRRSAGSCGPGGAARPRRCSCRACRSCSRWRTPSSSSATTRSTGPKTAEEQGDDVGLDDGAARRGEPRAQRRRRDRPDGKQGAFEALEAQASFDRVLFDGGEFGTGAEMGSDEELDFLGPARAARRRPGLRAAAAAAGRPDQRPARRPSSAAEALAEMDHRKQAELRKELSQLVGAWARKSGQPHGSVHNELRRRCGGPEVALADPDQLTARVAMVRGWFVGKK